MKKDIVMIMEDDEVSREMLTELFKNEYKILAASNGKEGLEFFVKNYASIAVVLMDLRMPVMGGMQVLELLSKKKLLSKVPFILITSEESVDIEKKGYEYGAVEYVRKPFYPDVVKQMVKNIIELFDYKTKLELMVKSQTEKLKQQNKLLEKNERKLRKMNDTMINTLSNVVEFRNMESENHIKRIREYTKCLGESVMKLFPEYNLTHEKLDKISSAAVLHDIGKIVLPESVILKPGKLNADETEIMKSHTSKGAEIVAERINFEDREFCDYCYDITRHHHERYDGTGYPDGLKEEQLSIAVQLVSLADAYDDLTSKHIYKAEYDVDQAYQIIMNGEEGAYSPKLLQAFTAVREKIEAIAEKYSDKE
ncbi:MAG: response regulator [Lachnospiraceae bacterium]|nr:response regulator [Lachnospiraceae bacterium]